MITLVGRHTTGGPDALFSFSTGEYVSLVGYGNERERDPGPSGSARSATPMLTRKDSSFSSILHRLKVLRRLKRLGDTGTHGVEVHIDHAGKYRGPVQQPDALEAAPSQKCPVQSSSRLARRAIGSLSSLLNQLILARRARQREIFRWSARIDWRYAVSTRCAWAVLPAACLRPMPGSRDRN